MKVLKKPLFWVILLCVEALVLVLLLTHGANEETKPAEPAVYICTSSPEPVIPPKLTLNEKGGTFVFEYSVFSSYIAMGKYQRDGDDLILKTGDELFTFVFRSDGKNYVFDASRSSELPKYRYSEDAAEALSPVPDGALFEKE